MARPNTDPITQSIDSLRTESSPDSVTPARVANLLQAIVDLISALSMVPDTEVIDIMQKINNAVSTANAASNAASAAQTNANNKKITQFKAEATAEGVTLTVKQSGHTALTFLFPVADASQAGIVLPSVFQSLLNADQKAENYKVATLLLSYTSTGVQFGIRLANGTTLQKDIGLATKSRNGIMSKADKQRLDGLDQELALKASINPDGSKMLKIEHWPNVMLYNVEPMWTGMDGWQELWDNMPIGSIYLMDYETNGTWTRQLYFRQSIETQQLSIGKPSEGMIYCHKPTGRTYRWNQSAEGGLGAFIPLDTDEVKGLQTVEVARKGTSGTTYEVPNGVLSILKPTTPTIRITLLEPASGTALHRILLKHEDYANFDPGEMQIYYNSTLIWDAGTKINASDLSAGKSFLVTIYDRKFADVKKYI